MRLTVLLTMAALAGILGLTPAVAAQETPADKPQENSPVYVFMKTTAGDIALELNREKAPITVENFLGYVDKGFYDGTVFHRIMPGFMIQGGGYTPEMLGPDGPTGPPKDTEKPIKNEWQNGLKNQRGSIAMARLPGQPDSATSQFFINVVDNAQLDRQQSDGAAYAVFGKVVEGMDTVDKIKGGETKETRSREKSLPLQPVKIESVRRMTPEEVQSLKARL